MKIIVHDLKELQQVNFFLYLQRSRKYFPEIHPPSHFHYPQSSLL